MRKIYLPIVVSVSMLCFLFLGASHKVSALSASSFQAGNIISDSIFTNANAMSDNDIQTFLSAQVPVCDTWGTQHHGSTPPPYVCLKDYVENPNSGQNNLANPGASIPGGMSAAQIIGLAARQYRINPQVLIV